MGFEGPGAGTNGDQSDLYATQKSNQVWKETRKKTEIEKPESQF